MPKTASPLESVFFFFFSQDWSTLCLFRDLFVFKARICVGDSYGMASPAKPNCPHLLHLAAPYHYI